MNADLISTLRAVLTALALLSFLGIVFWAYSKRARPGFDEAARLPFDEDDTTTAKNKSINGGDAP